MLNIGERTRTQTNVDETLRRKNVEFYDLQRNGLPVVWMHIHCTKEQYKVLF